MSDVQHSPIFSIQVDHHEILNSWDLDIGKYYVRLVQEAFKIVKKSLLWRRCYSFPVATVHYLWLFVLVMLDAEILCYWVSGIWFACDDFTGWRALGTT